ncbi:pyridoxal phosphate-dependent aminotransferase family protein [Xanthomonas albilineans]|uniref:Probable transferase protein n=1 Tax=Xanthomonas albilineans (strain GPE PC73 / CFBP 7063) TaxID=380358 RepID=D2UD18_XANAP|nr:pyridoxal phosphate-dependent aminotransferase family protein [Xanthomonas albilineans]CBA15451.1 probable transferase protein [Xanthomonas albilineans GPE PC73]
MQSSSHTRASGADVLEASDPLPQSGENFDPALLFGNLDMNVRQRARYVDALVQQDRQHARMPYHREIVSPADRQVMVLDRDTGKAQPMLMFGSNNYLGLANHPHVRERVTRTIAKYGTGIGGPPFLNGYLGITRELEQRLAAHKGQEDAMIFSSGFSANLALPGALMREGDRMYYDEYSHASWFDGLKLAGVSARRFPHNDLQRLSHWLGQHDCSGRDVFVAVEGVYSMDGDLAPLDHLVTLCKRHSAMLVVDDAHGTGVLGAYGGGSGEHFGVAKEIDVLMGTFSKTLAVNGGFVCGSRPLIEYLRWISRSYMFSAALPPATIAAVHGALDVIESEPERMCQLHANAASLCARLNALRWGLNVSTPSAILMVHTPADMDAKAAAMRLHQLGIFVNPVHFPAVPRGQERLRISVMSTHTSEDLQCLADCIDQVWDEHARGEARLRQAA